MKKWIIAAACILTFSGYAAAQSTPAKATTTTEKQTSKKGAETTKPAKKSNKKAAAEPIKLTIPRYNDSDTLTTVPKSGGKK